MLILRKPLVEGTRYEVKAEGQTVLEAIVLFKADTCGLHICSAALDEQRKAEAFRRLVERLIKDTHCSRILLDCALNMRAVAEREGFAIVQEGMLKTIDPLRKVIPDSCFDAEGYLNRQEILPRIPYGAFSVNRCGCAAIAVYNLMHRLQGMDDLSKIFSTLSRASLLQQSLGTNIVFLRADLKKRGVHTKLRVCTKAHALQLPAGSCGILLYMHRQGGHYVMYSMDENACGTFYNAVQGKDALHMSCNEFVNKHVFVPVFVLLQAER